MSPYGRTYNAAPLGRRTEAGGHAPPALADLGMLAETGMLAKGERPPASAERVSPQSVPVSASAHAPGARATHVDDPK
jgi:hypothetical protein